MDYVLFGMGYGATLMLLGWALRTFGPERKYKQIDTEDADQAVAQRNWVRFIQGLGGVLALAGTAQVVVTFIIMLINPTDTTGGFASIVIWAVLIVAVLVWCWLHLARYGMVGIWSRESGYGFGSARQSGGRALTGRSDAARVEPKPRLQTDHDPSVVLNFPSPPVDVESEVAESGLLVDEVNAGELESDELLSTDNTEYPDVTADELPEPEYDFGDASDTTVTSDVGGRAEAIRRLHERQSKLNRN